MRVDVKFAESAEQFGVKFGGSAESFNVGFSDAKTLRGKSAYEIAVDNGFIGSEADWLESLRGKDGYTPVKGKDYFTEVDISEMVSAVIAALPVYKGEVVVV